MTNRYIPSGTEKKVSMNFNILPLSKNENGVK
jgi:hypothetical protein